jgi:hypothetical protein
VLNQALRCPRNVGDPDACGQLAVRTWTRLKLRRRCFTASSIAVVFLKHGFPEPIRLFVTPPQ